MSPRGRERMDIQSYNRMRRKQTLLRQAEHWNKMVSRAETRLMWVKSRRFEIEAELKSLQKGV